MYTKEEYLEQLSSYHHFLTENGFEPDIEREGSKLRSVMWMGKWKVMIMQRILCATVASAEHLTHGRASNDHPTGCEARRFAAERLWWRCEY